MKKLQSLDEFGRSKAAERYGKIDDQTKYGKSAMSQDLRGKFDVASKKQQKPKEK